MEELIELLNRATKAYDEGHPIMTDKAWDELYFQLQELENRTGIILPDSPTQKVVYEVVNELEKVKHNHPMLSLDKTKELNTVKSFLGNKSFIAMCKMDGLTCSLKYMNGQLVSAETRGNGLVGENILHNAKVISSIPKEIPYKGELVVDGEIICTQSDFKTFEKEYKNPRNFAAGSIRLLSAKECRLRKLTFIAWDVIKGLEESNSVFEKLNILDDFEFETVPSFLIHKDQLIENETFEWLVEELKNTANNYGYPIDGIVFKFDDIEYGKTLGSTAHHFKNAIAYKFYDEVYTTELLNIEWTMGRTGTLTPVAVFAPIDIDGSVVERASLHNLSIMEETIGIPYYGQKIEVFKANMIIPQIADGDRTNGSDEKIIQLPEICPVCGGHVKIEENNLTKNLVCMNPACEGKLVNRLDHFCGKKGLDIKGLSKATLEKLIDWGWVENISDIFDLKKYADEWKNKAGFGERSVENILSAIENSKNCSLESFISAIGIPLIGRSMAKILLEHIYTYEDFRNKIDERFNFSEYNGFAGSKTDSLLNFNYEEADKVYTYLKIEEATPNEERVRDIQGLTVVITGRLNQYKNRAELQKAIEKIGGKVVGSISRNVDYLINNDINSTSAKNLSAKKNGIPILTEEEFVEKFLI